MEAQHRARCAGRDLDPAVDVQIDLSRRGLDPSGVVPDIHRPHDALGLVSDLIDFVLPDLDLHAGHRLQIDHRRWASWLIACEGLDGLGEAATIEVHHQGDDVAAAGGATVEELLADVD